MNTFKNNWSNYFLPVRGKKMFFPIILCLIVTAVMGYHVPQKIQKIFQSYGNPDLFFRELLFFVLIFIVIYITRVFYGLLTTKYVQYLMEEIRERCFRTWLLKHDVIHEGQDENHHEYPMGEVLSRIVNDTESLRDLVTSGAFGVFLDIFFLLSGIISFFMIDLEAGFILVAAEVLACLALLWGSRSMAKVFLNVRKASAQMSRVVANVTAGMPEMYYTTHHQYASKKSLSSFKDFLKKQNTANVWDASYYSLAESLYPFFLLLMFAALPITGIKEAAIIAVLVDLIQRAINPVKSLTSNIANIQRAMTGITRINEFLNKFESSQIEISSASGGDNFIKEETFMFDHLSVNIQRFQYDSHSQTTNANGSNEDRKVFVLDHIQFTAHKGELIGIVGLSGSGKSTLLNVLAGNIIPKDCEIVLSSGMHEQTPKPKVKGEKNSTILTTPSGLKSSIVFPHSDLDKIRYRQQISLVSQDSHVFSESVEFNISLVNPQTYGHDSLTSQKFNKFWQEMKMQLPYLAKWGLNPQDKINVKMLSAGQKQLISALRACYLQRPVVLLDEISSALDTDLEESLRQTVLLIQRYSITIIVAHRIETIIRADQIIVLHEGKIENQGQHRDLLKKSVVYQSFINEISSLT
jgi:ATP-binding cassette subfamily B protein